MIVIGNEARDKMMTGINLVADAVSPTLGPMAKTVVLKEFGKPIIVNDGVTVAKAVSHEDQFIDMGAKLLISVATQAQNIAGDGTTTACVLAQAFCEYGMKRIEEGVNAIHVVKEMNDYIESFVEYVGEQSIPVENIEHIRNVASIAANNDSEIGALIAEAFDAVGNTGIVTVKESKSMITSVDVVKGMQLDRGYRSPYMATDNKCDLEDPLVLISNFRIVHFQDMLSFLEKIAESKRPLLLISRTLEQQAISNLIANILSGVIKCCAIECPDYGEQSDAIMRDIAALTNGKFFDMAVGDTLDKVNLEDLGTAEMITITDTTTLIVNGGGDETVVAEYAKTINVADATNDWMADKMKARIAKLVGGVAVLNVGAVSEVEMRDKKERIDDALNATRAAMEMGIVAGGGFWHNEWANSTDHWLSDALIKPMLKIAENAGLTVDMDNELSLNARTGEYVDLFSDGVIDPVKVIISSITSAASVASLVLTSEVLIGEEVQSEGMPIL